MFYAFQYINSLEFVRGARSFHPCHVNLQNSLL